MLVVQTLHWPDEVRAADFGSLDGASSPSKQELAMAMMLVDSMSEDFHPESYAALQRSVDKAKKSATG